ncbi:MAG TPA: carboxypeptidase regulatory-like domain-containing protein [Pyrinomonadaceae bacterium]|nr:carboxypeptidase regulatory-like domain-containing protein [Pyrinomonadaceae bacterium]
MRRNSFFITLVAAVMLLLCNLSASAQTGQLFGEVTMQQADGTTVPAAGAQIDVIRLDVSGKYQTKTDKNGKFIFAGIPFIGTYAISASAPNAKPDVIGDVKAGREVNYKLTLTPGDGKRPTEDEVRALAKSGAGNAGSGGGESEEDRKKRAELEAKNAEIMASNKKIEESNAIVARTAKAGYDFLIAKRYDEAIAQFNEGIAADPTHPGQPVLLTNKSVALANRGITRFNESVTAKDDAGKVAGREAASKDWHEAVESAKKAYDFIKAQAAPTEPAALDRYNKSKYLALVALSDAYRLLTKIDQTQAEPGFAAYQEYIAVETDPAKKLKAQVDAAEMLRVAGAWEKALAEFKKILEANPDNVDALRGAGLSLFLSPNKADYQEAANFLQRFVDKAPDTHPEKASAKEALDFLKTQENVKPEKASGGRRRG